MLGTCFGAKRRRRLTLGNVLWWHNFGWRVAPLRARCGGGDRGSMRRRRQGLEWSERCCRTMQFLRRWCRVRSAAGGGCHWWGVHGGMGTWRTANVFHCHSATTCHSRTACSGTLGGARGEHSSCLSWQCNNGCKMVLWSEEKYLRPALHCCKR
jgi:hypothetical protein